MEPLIKMLNWFTTGGPNPVASYVEHTFNIGFETFALLVGLALLGTNLVNNICERTSFFNYGLSFVVLFIGGALANSVLLRPVLPMVDSELAIAAIMANIGMTIAGLILVFFYRRSAV